MASRISGPDGHANFVHLRVRSIYSLLQGAIRPHELAELARNMRAPAVAVTDTNNLFGAYEISGAVAKQGVQPITGVTLSVGFPDDLSTPVRHPSEHSYPSVALLVKDGKGYVQLSKLISSAYLDVAPNEGPHATLKRLLSHSDGLILLTGGPDGPVNRLLAAGLQGPAEKLLDCLAEAFGDRLYVELQRHGVPTEAAIEERLVELAYRQRLPLVATNDAHFAAADMYEAADALFCIADSTFIDVEDRRRLTREHRFKSADEMAALFSDLPEAIANTVEIARRCAFRPKKHAPILPQFIPESGLPPEQELRAQAESGLFLIVSDFMKWTRGEGIPVGVRGSGATSLVAWALDITNLDPIRFGLVFERFLNPERISMPDFDIDFCQERRDEVIRYVQSKYGKDRVGHIIALGSLQPRAAVRDVGRVMQLPFGLVDRLAKLIPNPPGKPVPLAKAMESEPRLQHRRCDWRSPVGRNCAALSRSALRNAGDTIRL